MQLVRLPSLQCILEYSEYNFENLGITDSTYVKYKDNFFSTLIHFGAYFIFTTCAFLWSFFFFFPPPSLHGMYFSQFAIYSLWNAIEYTFKNILYYICMRVYPVMLDSLWPHGLSPGRCFCPWNLPCKNTGMGCHFLLQGTFLTQGLDSGIEPRSLVSPALTSVYIYIYIYIYIFFFFFF